MIEEKKVCDEARPGIELLEYHGGTGYDSERLTLENGLSNGLRFLICDDDDDGNPFIAHFHIHNPTTARTIARRLVTWSSRIANPPGPFIADHEQRSWPEYLAPEKMTEAVAIIEDWEASDESAVDLVKQLYAVLNGVAETFGPVVACADPTGEPPRASVGPKPDMYVLQGASTMWPFDTTRPLAFFGSHDKKTWVRVATAISTNGFSFEAQPPITGNHRFLKIDYDDQKETIAPFFIDGASSGSGTG